MGHIYQLEWYRKQHETRERESIIFTKWRKDSVNNNNKENNNNATPTARTIPIEQST